MKFLRNVDQYFSFKKNPDELRPIFLFKAHQKHHGVFFFFEDFRWTFWCQKTAVAISNIAHPKLHRSALPGGGKNVGHVWKTAGVRGMILKKSQVQTVGLKGYKEPQANPFIFGCFFGGNQKKHGIAPLPLIGADRLGEPPAACRFHLFVPRGKLDLDLMYCTDVWGEKNT